MAAKLTIDVRPLAPPDRHRVVVETYTRLSPGETFVLLNDHDLRPFYHQMDAEHTGEFTWRYLEQGPKTWRVKIGRAGN